MSREVKRNYCDGRCKYVYRWELAQRKYEKRMKHRPHYIKFTDEMKRTVHSLIVYGQYSPEQIAGRFTMRGEEMVCKEIIYKWIWKEKRRDNDEMARNLRHHGRRKRKRGSHRLRDISGRDQELHIWTVRDFSLSRFML